MKKFAISVATTSIIAGSILAGLPAKASANPLISSSPVLAQTGIRQEIASLRALMAQLLERFNQLLAQLEQESNNNSNPGNGGGTTKVPEPLTILSTGVVLGVLPILKKEYAKRQDKED